MISSSLSINLNKSLHGLGKAIQQFNAYSSHKKLFKDAGFEDPWELYKKGEWTWDKIKEYGAQIYDEAEGIAMCTALDSNWGSINNVRSIVFDKDRYVENVTDANYVQSVHFLLQYHPNDFFQATPFLF